MAACQSVMHARAHARNVKASTEQLLLIVSIDVTHALWELSLRDALTISSRGAVDEIGHGRLSASAMHAPKHAPNVKAPTEPLLLRAHIAVTHPLWEA